MDSILAGDPVKKPVKRKYRAYILFSFAIAVILTLFVTGYYQSMSMIKSLSTLRDQSLQVDAVDNLLIELLDAETGVRGYLITGDRDYLERYKDAVEMLDSYLSEVDKSVDHYQHSDAGIERLNILLSQYKTVFKQLVEDKEVGNRINTSNMYLGKLTFDDARNILSTFKARLEFDRLSFYNEVSQRQLYVKLAFFALCTAALALLLWLFFTLQRQTKLQDKIANIVVDENKRLEQQVTLRTAQLTSLAAQLTRISEAEKQRLARELHDDLGASLTAAKMDAAWMATQESNEANDAMRTKSRRLLASLDHAITLKRRMTSNLLPPLLSELGLFEALRSLTEDMERDGYLKVSILLPEVQSELDHETSLALFRISQEAMTNIRKYAQAKNIVLKVQLENDVLVLNISDDGVGFDPDAVNQESFGLTSMQHRAQMIGGSFNIQSTSGSGTRIKVTVPLNNLLT